MCILIGDIAVVDVSKIVLVVHMVGSLGQDYEALVVGIGGSITLVGPTDL